MERALLCDPLRTRNNIAAYVQCFWFSMRTFEVNQHYKWISAVGNHKKTILQAWRTNDALCYVEILQMFLYLYHHYIAHYLHNIALLGKRIEHILFVQNREVTCELLSLYFWANQTPLLVFVYTSIGQGNVGQGEYNLIVVYVPVYSRSLVWFVRQSHYSKPSQELASRVRGQSRPRKSFGEIFRLHGLDRDFLLH